MCVCVYGGGGEIPSMIYLNTIVLDGISLSASFRWREKFHTLNFLPCLDVKVQG